MESNETYKENIITDLQKLQIKYKSLSELYEKNCIQNKINETLLIEKNNEIESQNEEYKLINEELKKTNEELIFEKQKTKETYEIFSQFLKNSPVYMFFKDAEIRPIRLSANYEKMIGMPLEQILGKTMDELFPSELAKSMIEDDLKILNEGKNVEVEEELDGKYYYTIKFPINIEGKPTYLAGFTIDNTERKKTEKLINEQNAKLQELNATKDKFFSIIAHDLKNPFNSILGLSEHLLNNISELDSENIKKYISFIYEGANKTYKLLENLLTWSRSQTGNIPFSPVKFNISDILAEKIILLKNIADNKEITIHTIFKNLDVYADVSMTKTIILNLLSNAIKYTARKGNITLKTTSNNENSVIISITDTGIGIYNETLKKIFDISEKISTTGTENETGTGLGLIICKEFIEKQNGKIWVESEVGKGSTFYFTLPINS
jgi:PAS domain S-box-containing protein